MILSTALKKKSIGILGGGQLARMLALKARQMGLFVVILSEKNSDPAASVASKWIKGKTTNLKDIKKLFKVSDVVTFESEFVAAEILRKCAKSFPKKQIFPNLDCLGRFQDRLHQKEWLFDNNIPTLGHVKINSRDEIDLAYSAFNHQMVFKKRMGGYDGYGTFVVKDQKSLRGIKKQIRGIESHFIIEPFVKFKSERSMIFARSPLGKVVSYPLIESVQVNNQCDYVVGPSHHPGENSLRKKITAALDKIDYVGVIAFELFEIGSSLVVNEIAPRVHNTGHFSQDVMNVDQFELHLRSILSLELPSPHCNSPAFVMVNLLGKTSRVPKVNKWPTGSVHWYEKSENRPRRKLGHINYAGSSKSNLLKKALRERKGITL